MSPRDAVGNELKEGQLVALDVSKMTNVIGRITKMENGGLVVGTNQLTPGKLVITVEFPLVFNPTKPPNISDLISIVEPPSETERLGKLINEKKKKPGSDFEIV